MGDSESHMMSIDIFTIDKRGVGMSRWPDPIMANNDHTPNITERYKNKIKIINHPANKGKGAAMAYGLSEAEGRKNDYRPTRESSRPHCVTVPDRSADRGHSARVYFSSESSQIRASKIRCILGT
jgi:hypothetical protein